VDEGFTRFEFVSATGLMAILGAVVLLFSLGSAAADGTRAVCADNVAIVDTAAASYSVQHPLAGQLTVAALTAKGTGTLRSWPRALNHKYIITIAGDGNRLVGTRDARGTVIEQNDIVVMIGGRVYDSTRSFATACASV
jgi:hypothetical protein